MEACEGRGSVLQGSVLTNKRSCVDLTQKSSCALTRKRAHEARFGAARACTRGEHATLLKPLYDARHTAVAAIIRHISYHTGDIQ